MRTTMNHRGLATQLAQERLVTLELQRAILRAIAAALRALRTTDTEDDTCLAARVL
jgi:hypothetical protein